MATSVNTYGQR